MDSFQEKYEYDKFVIETAHKIQEIQQDFNNLSDENKIKFQNDVMRAFMIKGIGVFQNTSANGNEKGA